MTPSPLAACRIGRAALLVAAACLCQCGLSAAGQGALSGLDDGGSLASSGGSSGSAYGGSSSGTMTYPSSGSSGGPDDADAPSNDDASNPFTLPPPGDAAIDARRTDAGPRDAAADAPSICAQLNACCSLLAAFGTSAMSVQTCMEAATGGDEGTCETLLGTFESVGLCL